MALILPQNRVQQTPERRLQNADRRSQIADADCNCQIATLPLRCCFYYILLLALFLHHPSCSKCVSHPYTSRTALIPNDLKFET